MQTVTVSERIQERGNAEALSSRARGAHPYIYVVGATGTAVIDPTNWQLIVIAPGITPGETGFLVDNHYRDQFGRLWSVFSATQHLFPWEAPSMGGVSVWDAKTFRNEKTIDL